MLRQTQFLMVSFETWIIDSNETKRFRISNRKHKDTAASPAPNKHIKPLINHSKLGTASPNEVVWEVVCTRHGCGFGRDQLIGEALADAEQKFDQESYSILKIKDDKRQLAIYRQYLPISGNKVLEASFGRVLQRMT